MPDLPINLAQAQSKAIALELIEVSDIRRITFGMKDFAACLAIREIGRLAPLQGAPPYVAIGDPKRRMIGVRSAVLSCHSKPFTIEGGTLCAVLIRMCKSLRVPIKRSAGKEVECEVDNVTLVVHLQGTRCLSSQSVRPETIIRW